MVTNGEVVTPDVAAASVYKDKRQLQDLYLGWIKEPEKMSAEKLQETVIKCMEYTRDTQKALNGWEMIDPKLESARKAQAVYGGRFESERAVEALQYGLELLQQEPSSWKDFEVAVVGDAMKYISLGHNSPDIRRNVVTVVSRYWETHPEARQRMGM